MTEALPASSKLRLLRVFNVLAAVFRYCCANFGRLFLFAWFACALYVLSLMLLEVLVFSFPEDWPNWLVMRSFDPPVWLTPFVSSPWEAMAWFFVLLAMNDPTSNRGVVVAPARRMAWLRFELNPEIWVAAGIFLAMNILAGFTRFARDYFLVGLAAASEPTSGEIDLLVQVGEIVRLVILGIVYAWFLPIIGQLLRSGTFDFARTHHALRGNRLRLIGIFTTLNIALWLIALLYSYPNGFLFQLLAGAQWSVRHAVLRAVTDFPYLMLSTVTYAVTVGIVLNALDERPPKEAGTL
jgi:hypothetical protein